jgi:hypothetical protein
MPPPAPLTFLVSDLAELEWQQFGAKISGLPGFPGRSLKICLKQLVWALARAIVPEPRTVPFWCREWLEKAHSLNVFVRVLK